MAKTELREIQWWREQTPEEVEEERCYANECDRLAEQDALSAGKKRWGRWYLARRGLCTRAIRPDFRGSVYDIGLDRLDEDDWVRHMGGKNWMGEQGLKDLSQAISELKE